MNFEEGKYCINIFAHYIKYALFVRFWLAFCIHACSHCGIVKKSNRKHRGLYVCSECGLVLNADVNASKNILQKGIPKSIWIGDRGRLGRPIVLKIS